MKSALSRALAASVVLASVSAASEASAQRRPGLDMSTWRPSTDPNASLVLEPAITPGHQNLTVGAYAAYAYRPIALRRPGSDEAAVRPVSDQLMFTPLINMGIGERFAFGASLPVVLYQAGTRPLPPSVSDSQSTPQSGIGDLGFNGKATIIRNEQGGFGLAALALLTLPTGDRNGFIGEVAPTVTGRVLAEYTLLVAAVQASIGYKLRTERKFWPDENAGGVRFGDELPWSIAIGMKPGVLGIDPKNRQRLEVALHGWLPAGPVGPFGSGDRGSSALSPVQLALSDRIELGHYRDVFATFGGELGLTQAVGVPVLRAVAGIGWTPRAHDMDGDGVKDDVDGCPEIPEDLDGFEDSDGCPDIDNDQDNIIDREDACPNDKGVASTDPKKNGCPIADKDGDGVEDSVDACPNEKGERSSDPQRNGCAPKDSDGDGIDDALDKCPTQAEDKDGFQDEDGCPDPDNDADGVSDKDDACPNVKGEASYDPKLNGCPNPDRDGDTFNNDEDKCPDAAEVFNGIDDDDGCADEGGKPLLVIETPAKGRPTVKLAAALKIVGTKELPEIDPASLPMLRALAVELNKHPDWTLAVGARPATADTQLEALARSFAIVKVLSAFSRRDGEVETVGWDAVKGQPGADSGIAFMVLVAPGAPVAAPAPTPAPAPAAAPVAPAKP